MNKILIIILMALSLISCASNKFGVEKYEYKETPLTDLIYSVVKNLNGNITVENMKGKVPEDIKKQITTYTEKMVIEKKDCNLIERKQLGQLKKELNFSNSEYVSDSEAVKIGKMYGVNYFIESECWEENNSYYFELKAINCETSVIEALSTKRINKRYFENKKQTGLNRYSFLFLLPLFI